MPIRPSNFWQELKRRKVIRVITVYAAAAFMLLDQRYPSRRGIIKTADILDIQSRVAQAVSGGE